MTDIHKWMLERMEAMNLDTSSQRYVVILDVYSVHRSAEFLEWWRASGMATQGLLVFVPANYTGQLQPLDISFNGPFKAHLRRAMNAWLAQVISEQFENGVNADNVDLKEQLQLKNMKEPFCAAMDQALRSFLTEVGEKHISRGFEAAGILACFGSGGEALYEKACQANDEGTLFPGGKNTNIDAALGPEHAADQTDEDIVASAMFDLLASADDMIVDM